MARLFVNIDHIATIREARKADEPNPVSAAVLAELAGADGITAHLREDRRHIKDKDVKILKEVLKIPFNLEMAATQEMVGIALSIRPHSVTLVPEKRMELTTEKGLDVQINKEELQSIISTLKDGDILVNLFIDPEIDKVKMASKLGAHAVELHTGEYANANRYNKEKELERLRKASAMARKVGLNVHAGHGLTYENLMPVALIPEIEELSIGHSIVARSSLVGMIEAVKQMKEIILESKLMK